MQGLRWTVLHTPISNLQSPQSNAIQIIITDEVKLDGYMLHAEFFQYMAQVMHIKVVMCQEL